MAITDRGLVASGDEATSDTTLTVTFSTTTAIGDLLHLIVATDNLSGSTPTVSSITDSRATWTFRRSAFRNSTAAAGIHGEIWSGVVTTAHANGNTLTVTLSGAVTAKAALVHCARGADTTATPVVSTPVDDLGANALAITNSPAAAGAIVIGFRAMEHGSAPTVTDSDTTNGSWSASSHVGTTGGASVAVGVMFQSKVVSATGSQSHTVTPTGAGTDTVAFAISWPEAGGAEAFSGGAETVIDVTASGAGNMQLSGGAEADVTVTASGAGNVQLQGGTETDVNVTASGAASTQRSGGAETDINVTASGAGAANKKGGYVGDILYVGQSAWVSGTDSTAASVDTPAALGYGFGDKLLVFMAGHTAAAAINFAPLDGFGAWTLLASDQDGELFSELWQGEVGAIGTPDVSISPDAGGSGEFVATMVRYRKPDDRNWSLVVDEATGGTGDPVNFVMEEAFGGFEDAGVTTDSVTVFCAVDTAADSLFTDVLVSSGTNFSGFTLLSEIIGFNLSAVAMRVTVVDSNPPGGNPADMTWAVESGTSVTDTQGLGVVARTTKSYVGVSATGGGTAQRQGGTEADVNVTASGAASTQRSGGSSASLTATVTGGGGALIAGGAETDVNVTATGAGFRTEPDNYAGGASTTVNLTAAGAASTQRSSGADTDLTVSVVGEGIRTVMGGTVAYVTLDAYALGLSEVPTAIPHLLLDPDRAVVLALEDDGRRRVGV